MIMNCFSFLSTCFSKIWFAVKKVPPPLPDKDETTSGYLNFLHKIISKHKPSDTTQFFNELILTETLGDTPPNEKWKKIWYPKPFPYSFLNVVVNTNTASLHDFKVFKCYVRMTKTPTLDFAPVPVSAKNNTTYIELPNRTDLLIEPNKKRIILTPSR